MKFRKITRILAVMAFATLMQATQAYADIIKIDAISLGSNPDVFMKFDDKLGSLIDVTYYYSGSIYLEILYEPLGDVVAASDWAEGITMIATTCVSPDIACIYLGPNTISGIRLFIPSFDIFEGLNIINIDFDFELSIPLNFAVEDFSIITYVDGFNNYNSIFRGGDMFCVVDGRVIAVIGYDICFSGVSSQSIQTRIEYTYDAAGITTVSTPSTLAIFALGLMGIMSRRFKKQS
jgi:hypothetical protein